MAALALAAMLAAAAALLPTVAAAHGGPRVYSGDAGPYRVEAYRLFGVSGEQRVLTYTVFLRERGSGRPVDGAAVTVSARRGEAEAHGPNVAWAFANQYEVQFEILGDEGTWTVDVEIDGPLGRATLTHALSPPSSWLETLAPWVIPLLIIAAGYAFTKVRSRRRSVSGNQRSDGRGKRRSRGRRAARPTARPSREGRNDR